MSTVEPCVCRPEAFYTCYWCWGNYRQLYSEHTVCILDYASPIEALRESMPSAFK